MNIFNILYNSRINRIFIITLTLIAGIVNTVPRWLDFNNPCCRRLYFQGQALSIFLWILALLFKIKDAYSEIFIRWTLGIAFSNLMDELFFDPTKFGWNELVILFLVTSYGIHEILHVKRINSRGNAEFS